MSEAKTRVAILTDISSLQGGFKEPDDTQSLVRLLLYANELEIEGLIATYTKHWPGEIKPEYIRAVVEAYGVVRERLAEHDPRYPTADRLLAVVKGGNPHDGPDFVGEGHDTEGSDWIVRLAEKEDERPLWILVWGGTTDLAQALWRAERSRSAEQFARLLGALRIYSIGDQYGMGSWLRDRYPDLFYMTGYKTYRGVYKGGDASLVAPEWLRAHATEGHGALGAAYPIYRGGDVYGGPVLGMKEGDTPSLLHVLPNGLGDPERPEWGGWGGRFAASAGGPPNHYFDAGDEGGDEHADAPLWKTVYRWRPAYQASFRARLDWCVKSPAEANHEPVAAIAGPAERSAAAGERVLLSAAGSRDPDGDGLTYDWFFYREPSGYKGELAIEGADSREAAFTAPEVSEPCAIHLVLTVTDDGEPPLSAYRRVIIRVFPKGGVR